MKKFILLYLLLGCPVSLFAQYFQTGQDPASIRWRQINTENFQLIYPDYYEDQAQELASKLETVYDYGSFSLNHKPQKISVILHTQTVVSNGLVAWAPRRAEFYTTPHQSIYPQDWLEQLVLHEFRHVVQVDKVDKHIPGLIKAILGQQGTALIFGSYLPWWFIEGDAVATETALSRHGRGRFPSFLMEHRAQVVEKNVFSYDKAYFGSYRDFVSNHYKLGYFIVGGARERYGSRLWNDVLDYAGRKPFSIFPMNKVLRQQTGFKKNELYQSVFDSLRNVWVKEDKAYQPPEYKVLSPAANEFTSYKFNHWLTDSAIISYKTSFDEIPSFVSIHEKTGEEKKIFFPGTVFDESVSFAGNWIVWSEQIPDPRWEHSGKSLLRLLNVKTKKKIEIDTEYKCFSPALSEMKNKLVVVESDFSNNYFLSVYSVPDGILLQRYQTQDNHYFFSPQWINENEVAVITLSEKGKRIAKVNFDTRSVKTLFDKDLGDIKHLQPTGGYLYFISSYSGKNSLYRMKWEDNSIQQIYEPRFGTESPAISPDGEKILLSDYTSDGFRLSQVPAHHDKVNNLENVEKGNYPLADALSEQEMGIPDFSGTDTFAYQSMKYSKPVHLFNFHSWAPLFIDADAYDISPGASLMSQNKLGTTETVLGYKWDITEKTGKFYLNHTFKGWYPLIDFELSTGKRASEYLQINQTKNQRGEIISRDTTKKRFTWSESRGSADIRLPLNFGKGAFNRYLQPEIQYDFTSYKRHVSTPERFRDGNFHTLNYRLYYHQLLKRSFQDVYPDVGVVLDMVYRHSPGGTLNLGNQAAIQTIIYLPGIASNHGIKLYGGAQESSNDGSLGFSDMVRYARGWGRINTTQLYTATADYKFPLAYPDWNFKGLFYLKRLKVSLFGDITKLKGKYNNHHNSASTFVKDISSFGTEFTADVNILRFYAPADIGFRASYLPEMKNIYFDLLFSINFTSL